MTDGASLLIRHKVRDDSLDVYEKWLKRVIDIASEFSGHEGVFVLKPVKGENLYEIAVRFADEASAREWLCSTERQALLAEIKPHLLASDNVEIRSGIDYWFTRQPALPHQPVRWKQWLLLAAVIWVLTVFTEPLYARFFDLISLPDETWLRAGFMIVCNVGLIVYVIMPYAVRLTSPWIFRK